MPKNTKHILAGCLLVVLLACVQASTDAEGCIHSDLLPPAPSPLSIDLPSIVSSIHASLRWGEEIAVPYNLQQKNDRKPAARCGAPLNTSLYGSRLGSSRAPNKSSKKSRSRPAPQPYHQGPQGSAKPYPVPSAFLDASHTHAITLVEQFQSRVRGLLGYFGVAPDRLAGSSRTASRKGIQSTKGCQMYHNSTLLSSPSTSLVKASLPPLTLVAEQPMEHDEPVLVHMGGARSLWRLTARQLRRVLDSRSMECHNCTQKTHYMQTLLGLRKPAPTPRSRANATANIALPRATKPTLLRRTGLALPRLSIHPSLPQRASPPLSFPISLAVPARAFSTSLSIAPPMPALPRATMPALPLAESVALPRSTTIALSLPSLALTSVKKLSSALVPITSTPLSVGPWLHASDLEAAAVVTEKASARPILPPAFDGSLETYQVPFPLEAFAGVAGNASPPILNRALVRSPRRQLGRVRRLLTMNAKATANLLAHSGEREEKLWATKQGQEALVLAELELRRQKYELQRAHREMLAQVMVNNTGRKRPLDLRPRRKRRKSKLSSKRKTAYDRVTGLEEMIATWAKQALPMIAHNATWKSDLALNKWRSVSDSLLRDEPYEHIMPEEFFQEEPAQEHLVRYELRGGEEVWVEPEQQEEMAHEDAARASEELTVAMVYAVAMVLVAVLIHLLSMMLTISVQAYGSLPMGTNPSAGEEQQSKPKEEAMDDAGWTHVKARDVLEQEEAQEEAMEDGSDKFGMLERDGDEDLDGEEFEDEDLACMDGDRSDYDDDDELSDEEDVIAEKTPEEEVASDDEDWDMVDMAEN